MRSELPTFTGARGQELVARLELPEGEPVASALFVHCFACSRDAHAAPRVSHALVSVGIAVLRFDFTGLGSSQGEEPNREFVSNIDDLVAAADYLRSRKLAPALLVGHSLGGTALLAAAHRIPEARALATINSPSDARHLRGLITEGPEGPQVRIAGKLFRVKPSLLEELEEQNVLELVHELKRSLLIFHAPFDKVAPLDDARAIYQAAMHPKSFLSMDGADHLLTDKADASYVAHVLSAWASRYLHAHLAVPLEGELTAPDRVLVEETGEGRLAERISVGRHVIRADEPTTVGGNDTGPTPYDLLLSALGACTAMTLRLFAERKGWPLEHVSVELRHEKIHAEDCATCETENGMLDRIERRLRLEGPLDAAQRERLREIADRCPVHRSLESEVEVITEL